MKYLILLLITLFTFSTTNSWAQIEKGSIFLGGSLESNLDITGGDYATFLLAMDPSIGIFVGERTALGLNVGLSYVNDGASMTIMNVLPFFRYYFSGQNTSNFFLEAKGGLSMISSSFFDSSSVETTAIFAAGPGIGFVISDWAALEMVLHYRTDEELYGSNIDLTIGFQIYL